MDIDEALLQVGGMRPYHWLLFALIGIAIFVPLAANGMLYVFIGWTPGHHCKADNGTHNDSYIFNANLSQCEMPVDGTNMTQPCQYGWVYDIDASKESSIVTEWDLVCDNDYHAELSETISCVGSIIGLLFVSPFADKYGRKPLFFISLFLYVILGTAMAFSPSLTAYNIVRFILSCVSDALASSGMILMMELYSTKHRTFAGVLLEIYWIVAYFYMAMLMYLLHHWQPFLLVTVVPWIVFMGLYWMLPESALWLLSVDRPKDAIKSLKFLARRNCVDWKPPEDLAMSKESNEEQLPFRKQLLLLVKDPILRKHTIMTCLFWFTDNTIYTGITFIMPALTGDKLLSIVIGGLVELPAYIICMFALRYGRRISTLLFLLLSGVSLLVGALIIALGIGGDHQGTIMLTVGMIGKFGISGAFAVIVIYCMELYPTTLRGTGNSYTRLFARIGALGLPFIAYWLKYNRWMPLVLMGILGVGTGLATLVLPETCDKPLPQTLPDVYALYKKKHIPVSTDETPVNTKDTL